LAIKCVNGVGGLLSELLPLAIVGRIQENKRNGQAGSDIVEASEPCTTTRAALHWHTGCFTIVETKRLGTNPGF